MSVLDLLDHPGGPADPQPTDARILANNKAKIEKVINGGLDANNLGVDFPVMVATSVAGLGTARQGKRGLLRCGLTPFEFVTVTYDGTLGKWVSKPLLLVHQQDRVDDQDVDGGGHVKVAFVARPLMPNYKALYDAGLRPQTKAALKGTSDGNFVDVFLDFFEVADSDTAVGTSRASWNIGSFFAASARYIAGNWEDPFASSAPTKDHAQPKVFPAWSGATFDMEFLTVWLRWVSA